jgi:hypothetical protein
MSSTASADALDVDWRKADAQYLPFPDGEFDAVVCQFGVMFFPDKPGALSEAYERLVEIPWAVRRVGQHNLVIRALVYKL